MVFSRKVGIQATKRQIIARNIPHLQLRLRKISQTFISEMSVDLLRNVSWICHVMLRQHGRHRTLVAA